MVRAKVVGPLGVVPIEGDPGARLLLVEAAPGVMFEIPLDEELAKILSETLGMDDDALAARLEVEQRDARAAAVAADAALGARVLQNGAGGIPGPPRRG